MHADQEKHRASYTHTHTRPEARAYLVEGQRRKLVGWLAAVGEKLKMRRATVHVAIAYLDRLFQRRVSPKEKWQMLAISCLQIASKYEEAEENVPAVTQLSRASGIGLTISTVQRWEVAVLDGLEWKLTCIVPLHFVDYFLTRGVLYQEDHVKGVPMSVLIETIHKQNFLTPKGPAGSSSSPSISPVQPAPAQLRKHAHFFAAYVMIQEYASMAQHSPCFVASVCVYLARLMLNVTPTWRPELCELTGQEEGGLVEVAHTLLASFRQDYPTYIHSAAVAAAALSASAAAAGGAGGVGAVNGLHTYIQTQTQTPTHNNRLFGGGGGSGGVNWNITMAMPDPPPFDYHLPQRVASV